MNNKIMTNLKVLKALIKLLKTESEVYGVVINKKMHKLNKQVQPYKSQVTDMVPVEIKGKIIPKPDNEEGWPYRIEIKEIVHISKPKFEDNNEKY